MGRLFNSKCGITAKDEVLPGRMHKPITNGILKGTTFDKKTFDEGKKLYYDMTGMDEDGKPRYGKIVELELEELWD
jgi:aldehyde:ferredoxin oxidoreductase